MKVAIVIPWFGKELKGGAEQHAWQIAKRLTEKRVNVVVLTTCSKEFLSDWSHNYYNEGIYFEANIKIKRFKLEPCNTELFDKINGKLINMPKSNLIPGLSPLTVDEEKLFLEENIYSPSLQNYIESHNKEYDVFIFLPYLFPNIIKGINTVNEKALFQPCLHDEPYAYLNCVHQNFLSAKSIVYLSSGEKDVARKIFGPSILSKSKVLYAGIEPIFFPEIKYGNYLLYLGRRDVGKNTDLLIESFDQFVQTTGSKLKLYIAGVGDLPIKPKTKNIVDCGLVSDKQKKLLLGQCLALINPSENESFSRVIFESWSVKKPIIIHKECKATYHALKAAGSAGFFANDRSSFVDIYKKIDLLSKKSLKTMGETGCAYANKIANWDNVINNYIQELRQISLKNEKSENKAKKQSIHQLLPTLSYGDAISNQAISIKTLLQSKGYKSKIFVRYIDPKVQSECEPLAQDSVDTDDILIYHHSIGFEYTEIALNHIGKKALIYHNITPKDFFEPYDKKFAKILDEGRAFLKELCSSFDFNLGDSQFNCDELILNGFLKTSPLPLIVTPEKWGIMPDNNTIKKFSDGKKNILFTGRIAPNKKQTDLLKMMYYLKQIDPSVRLFIVGSGEKDNPYVQEFYKLIDHLELQDDVIVTGHVSDSKLKSYFMLANLFVSMSEHEGFGVPLIEAMWFDIPVLAYKSSAIPETLAEAGLMFTCKKDMLSIASLVNIVLNDSNLQDQIINAQRVVRSRYSLKNVEKEYNQLIKNLTAK